MSRESAATKNKKFVKDKSNLKDTTSIFRKQRPTLSQNFSFPAKSACEDAMQKSIDGKVKHVQGNDDTRVKASSTLHHSNKSKNSEMNSTKEKRNNEGSNKRTTLTSMPSLKRSVVVILFPHCISLLLTLFIKNILILCDSLECLLQLLLSPRATHLRHPYKSQHLLSILYVI